MNRKLITIIILTLVTISAWIGLEVLMNLTSSDVEDDYSSYMIPIQPSLNQEIIDSVLEKEDEYLMVDRDVLE